MELRAARSRYCWARRAAATWPSASRTWRSHSTATCSLQSPSIYQRTAAPQATPVTPTFDPKIEANALYGKPMALSAVGYARIGASPAPIVGPYINGDTVDFIVSFGVPANVEGDRKIYKIYLDNELAWSSVAGGTLPGDGTFAAEAFDFVFKPGTLTRPSAAWRRRNFPATNAPIARR